jgi:hypothetical protein
MGLSLSEQDVDALEARTEGWVAGLQLAALSMQGRNDATHFVRAFAGDNRYIVDYLIEEVLQHQPQAVRDFLLQTSILDRLSGPLCDAVTEQANSKALLDALERANLFVIPLKPFAMPWPGKTLYTRRPLLSWPGRRWTATINLLPGWRGRVRCPMPCCPPGPCSAPPSVGRC